MRIPCPFCGDRDLTEFTYLGDATVVRPAAELENADELFYAALYLRDNPAGPHTELWYHSSGCRTWLRVSRNTRTHEISHAEFAKPVSSA